MEEEDSLALTQDDGRAADAEDPGAGDRGSCPDQTAVDDREPPSLGGEDGFELPGRGGGGSRGEVARRPHRIGDAREGRPGEGREP
jgi:hypothetical protein